MREGEPQKEHLQRLRPSSLQIWTLFPRISPNENAKLNSMTMSPKVINNFIWPSIAPWINVNARRVFVSHLGAVCRASCSAYAGQITIIQWKHERNFIDDATLQSLSRNAQRRLKSPHVVMKCVDNRCSYYHFILITDSEVYNICGMEVPQNDCPVLPVVYCYAINSGRHIMSANARLCII